MEYEFWMVWSPTGRGQSVKHADYNSALSEAKRLSTIDAGKDFYVLHAEKVVRTRHPIEVTTLEEAPF